MSAALLGNMPSNIPAQLTQISPAKMKWKWTTNSNINNSFPLRKSLTGDPHGRMVPDPGLTVSEPMDWPVNPFLGSCSWSVQLPRTRNTPYQSLSIPSGLEAEYESIPNRTEYVGPLHRLSRRANQSCPDANHNYKLERKCCNQRHQPKWLNS